MTDDRSIEAIDGDVEPVAFFTFNDEIAEALRVWRVMPRLRDQVDLGALSSELLAVADQTMQPTLASLWLRSSPPGSSDMPINETTPATWAY